MERPGGRRSKAARTFGVHGIASRQIAIFFEMPDRFEGGYAPRFQFGRFGVLGQAQVKPPSVGAWLVDEWPFNDLKRGNERQTRAA